MPVRKEAALPWWHGFPSPYLIGFLHSVIPNGKLQVSILCIFLAPVIDHS
jgi:hypothetical protein